MYNHQWNTQERKPYVWWAEDLRAARARLGITSAQAARRAGVAAARYGALEKGSVPSSQDILRKLFSVCRRLDMESVRVAYVEEIGQYANIHLARDAWREPLTAFLDVLEAECRRTPGHRVFHQPCRRLRLPGTHRFRRRRWGPGSGRTSRWWNWLTGAVFTLFLDEVNDYYVKPVKDDPPDVEVLAVERDSRAFSTMKLEIVQDGKYSESVFEVIGKKLTKRYERGDCPRGRDRGNGASSWLRNCTTSSGTTIRTACGFSSSAALEKPAGSRGCHATRSRVTARTISSGWRRRSISGTGTPAS